MRNVNAKVSGDKLVIEIDISEASKQNAPFSKTGKSKLVSSTGGFVPVAPGLSLSLNLSAK